MIQKYYQALIDKDIKTLKEIIHPNIYGIRTFDTNTYYERSTFIDALNKTNYQTVNIDSVSIDESTLVNGVINDTPFIVKFSFKDNFIYKVYESVKTGKRRIKAIISYDGSSYLGYQKQVNGNTIQQTLEDTLNRALKQVIQVYSSGRTDKGVHAHNQVFHFDLDSSIPLYNLRKVLNSYLPDSIYIKSVEDVNETFHSRYDVAKKTYCYKINTQFYDPIQRHYEWYVENLDINEFKKNLNYLLGTHDFQSFTKTTDKDTLRTIYNIHVDEKDGYLYTYITGNGFLRYMVRNLIGACVMISKQEVPFTINELLEKRDVNLLKDKAPACGLYLEKVEYNV